MPFIIRGVGTRGPLIVATPTADQALQLLEAVAAFDLREITVRQDEGQEMTLEEFRGIHLPLSDASADPQTSLA